MLDNRTAFEIICDKLELYLVPQDLSLRVNRAQGNMNNVAKIHNGIMGMNEKNPTLSAGGIWNAQ